MRVLMLVSDAYGGHGGIARFNRDFAEALGGWPKVRETVILPRATVHPPEAMPDRVRQKPAPPGKAGYMAAAARLAWSNGPFDVIVCGHINLLPAAYLAHAVMVTRHRPAPPPALRLVIHGIDAWQPTGWRAGLARLDGIVSVSQVTLDRFRAWSGIAAERCTVLPNTVDLNRFTPGPPPADLVARYGLAGKRVVMGLSRLDAGPPLKGFDEMFALLPRLAETHPDLVYLLCGDGEGRPRLEALARHLGCAERVIFTGMVPEARKADHYRLADAFVLAGYGEGFGIVLLEAMACGVPVVASRLDGSCEPVLGGRLGALADPSDPSDLAAAVLRALARPRGRVPEGLENFSHAAFAARVRAGFDKP